MNVLIVGQHVKESTTQQTNLRMVRLLKIENPQYIDMVTEGNWLLALTMVKSSIKYHTVNLYRTK